MITYPPHPFGSEITIQDILSQTKQIKSWEDKYRFIIQLGKKLPPFSEEQRQNADIIKGCESQVWFHWEIINNQMHLFLDADARIVKGLLALVLIITQQKSKKEIQETDFDAYFCKLSLIEHLSESRNNGLQSILAKIRVISK